MANDKQIEDCEACPGKGILTNVAGIRMCESCLDKEKLSDEVKYATVEVQPSTTPVSERLKKAYIDKFNGLLVSGMSHEQLKNHIADLEDMVKVLQTQVQASMDVDDEWSRALTNEQRETLKLQDKKYRALARPATNSDGTLKTSKPREAKPVIIGDSGTKAFENLVNKLTATGMSRENAVKMIQGMKGQ